MASLIPGSVAWYKWWERSHHVAGLHFYLPIFVLGKIFWYDITDFLTLGMPIKLFLSLSLWRTVRFVLRNMSLGQRRTEQVVFIYQKLYKICGWRSIRLVREENERKKPYIDGTALFWQQNRILRTAVPEWNLLLHYV